MGLAPPVKTVLSHEFVHRRRNLGAPGERWYFMQIRLIPPISWHKALLILAGVLVLFYATWVLWYVYSIPDIGLRTAFDTHVKQFEGDCVGVAGEPAQPQVEDEITRLGDRSIKSWARLLQALNDLGETGTTYVPAKSLATVKPGNGSYYVETDDGKFVYVEFLRSPGDQPLACWCRVGRLPPKELVPSILWFFLKFGLFVVGALVLWKRPADVSARQFFLLCIVTLGAYMGGYHWSHLVRCPELILVFMVCSIMLPAVLLHFNAIFPRPNRLLEKHPWGTLLAIYVLPFAFLAAIVAEYFLVRTLDQEGYPDDLVNYWLVALRVTIYVYLCVAALWYLASIVCLVVSYRSNPDATERNQVKWILFGSLGALVPIGTSLYLAVLKPVEFSRGDATWWMFAASVCFTTAFVISITRYRLMQLDQIISSGMVYFFISFLFGVVYYAVIFIGTLIVGSHSGPDLSQALSVSTIALVFMLLFDRARSRIKKALDRRFYREKHQLDRTLQRMGQAIDQLVDPPTLAKQLLQASAEVLNVSRGAVYLRQGEPPLYKLTESLGPAPPLLELSSGCPLVEAILRRGSVLAAANGSPLSDPVRRQLRFLGGEVAHGLAHEGELLALLVLGPKDLGWYTTEDLNLLTAFAQLTALALKSAERHRTIEGLNRELHTKVEKISEQQRRIIALQSQLTRQTAAPEAVPDSAAAAPSDGIIGSSTAVQELLQLVRKVSASQSAVLFRGESGTGKELLALALHESSPRAGKAFVKVHCAALSPSLLESELFGHVKGAFTGAHRDKVGRFELANGGTLFLDEIGDISLEVQTKLLRVLQEKTFERVGSSEPVQVDVRVIAATHQNLERLISEERFREDLFYRLNVISLHVPPLRERREDIVELAGHFLSLHAQRCGKGLLQIDDDAMAMLKGYSWPGNIRQLENVIERAVVVSEGTEIGVADLPSELVGAVEHAYEFKLDHANGNNHSPDGPIGVWEEREERDRRERERLVRALATAKGNKAEAARALGLARSTLVSRLKKHGLS